MVLPVQGETHTQSWDEPGWIKLLHGRIQRSPNFYFSGESWTPESEWQASINSFHSTDFLNTNHHPQCRFPGRFLYLQKHTLEKFVKTLCPDYDEWSNAIQPEGVSIVFAGNYPDNPGSIFGHTFLKVTSSKGSRLQFAEGKTSSHSGILDYAINYAAHATDEIGIVYAIKGLLGGYYGYFSMDPYYSKVNDYSEGEGRDLWEYSLHFSAEESAFLLAHFWELKNEAMIDYYFLDDNCSLMILTLIDVVKPQWKLVNGDPLFVVPLETIKQLKKIPNAITTVHYRPSIRKRSDESFERLSFQERSEVKKIIAGKISPLSSKNENALYTSSLYLFSKRSYKDGKLSAEDDKILSESMKQLSQLPMKIEAPASEGHDPELGHDLKEVGIAAGLNKYAFTDFNFKLGIHDLMDFERGYLENSDLDLIQTKIRLIKNKFSVRESNIFNVGQLRPLALNSKHLSWRGRINYDGLNFVGCKGCRSLLAEVMGGVSYNLHHNFLGYVMAGSYANTFAGNLSHGSAGFVAESGIYQKMGDRWKILTALNFYQDMTRTMNQSLYTGANLGITYHPDVNWDINFRMRSPLLFLGSKQASTYEQSVGTDFHF